MIFVTIIHKGTSPINQKIVRKQEKNGRRGKRRKWANPRAAENRQAEGGEKKRRKKDARIIRPGGRILSDAAARATRDAANETPHREVGAS